MKYIAPSAELLAVSFADILTDSLLSQEENGVGDSKKFLDLIRL